MEGSTRFCLLSYFTYFEQHFNLRSKTTKKKFQNLRLYQLVSGSVSGVLGIMRNKSETQVGGQAQVREEILENEILLNTCSQSNYLISGMRVLLSELESKSPRPRSPHMNNEEPISLSHYPDGRPPEERADKTAPIERDDFPAPPYVYRRRHRSEPNRRDSSSSESSSIVQSSSDEENEAEFVDEKLDKTENELKKITSGMGKVFLQEINIEKQRRKQIREK